jgi:DNA polymerase bacteriophage-type
MTITWVVTDFETACVTDLKKSGAWRYAECPTLEVFCNAYQYFNAKQELEPKRLWHPSDGATGQLYDLACDPSVMFIAFNVQFEKAIWRNYMVQLGFPDVADERWHDIQATCAMKVLPLSLDNATLMLRLPAHKDTEGSNFTKALSRPDKKGHYDRSPAALAKVDQYCDRDIDAEVGLHRRVGWLPPNERRVWLLNQKVNQRGVCLDLPFIRAAQKVVDGAAVPLLKEFADLTGGLKPTQNEKFKAWLAGKGLEVTSLDKEHMAALLGNDIDGGEDAEDETDDPGRYRPVLSDPVRRALVIRSLIGSASVKKLNRMELCVCADGRSRGLLQYHGTGPGRSAGRLFQPHNFPRGTLNLPEEGEAKVTKVMNAIMTGDYKHVEASIGTGATEVVVSALRHAIVAAPGRVLLSADYAGIQARTVLALAGQHDKTAIMAAGKDIYCDMAKQIYKRPIDKKKDPAERQTGKNAVLGLGFQMGWRKFQFKYAKNSPDEFCENVVQVYRKEWAPLVPKVWYSLQDAAVETVHSGKAHSAFGVEYRMEGLWLSARLPSGRKIWYFNPKPIAKAMPWDDTDIRQAFTYQATKMGQMKTIDAFGGQLTENAVMGIERDLMTCAMLKCEENGMPVVLEVHDEIVIEPLVADADQKAFEQIMLDVEPWAKALQIPIAVETWMGERYRK